MDKTHEKFVFSMQEFAVKLYSDVQDEVPYTCACSA